MNEQELNKKLLIFAGFKFSHRSRSKNFFTGELGRYVGFWIYPDGDVEESPYFPNDLNAIFKWLVPNLAYWELGYKYYLSGMFYWAKAWAKDGIWREGWDKNNPALALCRAIEKLIDEP